MQGNPKETVFANLLFYVWVTLMRRDTLLLALTVAGSALWWWPLTIWPSLDLPWWLPLAFIALLTGLATSLSGGRWLRFVLASAAGTFAGLCSGYAIWLPTDEIPVQS